MYFFGSIILLLFIIVTNHVIVEKIVANNIVTDDFARRNFEYVHTKSRTRADGLRHVIYNREYNWLFGWSVLSGIVLSLFMSYGATHAMAFNIPFSNNEYFLFVMLSVITCFWVAPTPYYMLNKHLDAIKEWEPNNYDPRKTLRQIKQEARYDVADRDLKSALEIEEEETK